MRKRNPIFKDFLIEASIEDISLRYKNMNKHFGDTAVWIAKNCERDDEQLAILNLLTCTAVHLEAYSKNLEWLISPVALCTRNLFEINLRVRYVLNSTENLNHWMAESISDKLDVCKTTIRMAKELEGNISLADLEAEKTRLRDLSKKYALPKVERHASVSNIARIVGCHTEYKDVFQFVSKLIHPSSMMVNDMRGANSDTNHAILMRLSQKYAWDTYIRITKRLNVPDSVSKFHDSNSFDDA